jgi:hypothetical protein
MRERTRYVRRVTRNEGSVFKKSPCVFAVRKNDDDPGDRTRECRYGESQYHAGDGKRNRNRNERRIMSALAKFDGGEPGRAGCGQSGKAGRSVAHAFGKDAALQEIARVNRDSREQNERTGA